MEVSVLAAAVIAQELAMQEKVVPYVSITKVIMTLSSLENAFEYHPKIERIISIFFIYIHKLSQPTREYLLIRVLPFCF